MWNLVSFLPFCSLVGLFFLLGSRFPWNKDGS